MGIRYTEKQLREQIENHCAIRNYQFVSFISENNKITKESKISLKCLKHATTWNTTTIDSFLRGTGCILCSRERNRCSQLKSEEQAHKEFMASGKFREGTIFWRSDRKSKYKNVSYWKYTCPICSKDEYVTQGLCSGVFEAPAGCLRGGKLPCRCSKVCRLTQDQQEYRIKKLLLEENELTFIGWIGEYNNVFSKMILNCNLHGNWISGGSIFVHGGCRCPGCAVSGFKRELPSVVYVLRVVGGIEFTGYGISNDIDRRLMAHRYNLSKKSCTIGDLELFYIDGHNAWKLEKLIQKTFKLVSQKIPGFKKEATEYFLYDEVVEFAEKYVNELEPVNQAEIAAEPRDEFNSVELPKRRTWVE